MDRGTIVLIGQPVYDSGVVVGEYHSIRYGLLIRVQQYSNNMIVAYPIEQLTIYD